MTSLAEQFGRELELTTSQMLIWTGARLYPDRPLYNMAYRFDIFGPVDESLFKRSFQRLVDEVDSLRLVFPDPGSPAQIFSERIEYEPEFLDLKDQPGADLEDLIDEALSECLRIEQRCFESFLARVAEDHFVWFLNLHHIVSDAASAPLLLERLSEIYSKLSSNETDPESPEQLQIAPFRAFAEAEIRNRSDESGQFRADYWNNKLAELPPPPRYFGKRSDPSRTVSPRTRLELDDGRYEALLKLSGEKGIRSISEELTLFNIFAALYAAHIFRLTGTERIVIGSPVHNRLSPELKRTPGLLTEFFPFEVEVGREDSFLQVLAKVRASSGDLLKHASSGASSAKLMNSFNTVLNFISTDFGRFNDWSCEADWLHSGHVDPQHVLRLHVYFEKSRRRIGLFFDLNESVFGINSFVPEQFRALLDAFLADPLSRVVDAEIVLEEELAQIKSVNETDDWSPVESTIPEMFCSQAAATPDAVAVVDCDRQISFRELDLKSDALASLLESEGAAGKPVAVHLERSSDLVVSLLAVLKSGAFFIPVPVNEAPERKSSILSESRAKLIISAAERSEVLNEISSEARFIDPASPKPNDFRSAKNIDPADNAYVIFTSGSTGTPKGVEIRHSSFANYVSYAAAKYFEDGPPVFPLFTSIGFDLTLTSIFVPLVSGGQIVVFPEPEGPADLSLLDVVENRSITAIKLTPSHLNLLTDRDLTGLALKTVILGGEDLKTSQAFGISRALGGKAAVFNEYGPTEATVGCIVHKFDSGRDYPDSVPIGVPVAGMKAEILDPNLQEVPLGAAGELYISGPNLAQGYFGREDLTRENFVLRRQNGSDRLYATGDLARINSEGEIEYLGRSDNQVKISGLRIETEEIESALSGIQGVLDCAVVLEEPEAVPVRNCTKCGLPSNYPGADLDSDDLCSFCRSFPRFERRIEGYFGEPEDLRAIIDQPEKEGGYDCMVLLSGGKDSTFALAKISEMGFRPLAFTLDNGFISEQAKANIGRVVAELGVDHVFATAPAMNEIFADSLGRFSNVCNGCFKTIYTLAIKTALDKNIPFIVTGLSRGQFFETRLTEELFWDDAVDADSIDRMILDARKAYHRVDDAVARNLDTSFLENEDAFERVRFLDFYRYFDVTLEEMLKFLDERLPWVRPTDTGRSTNCLINQLGIYVHKREKGYSNYAFPYSWDVRIGHKTRDESLEEINEQIDPVEVRKMMDKIGYKMRETEEKGAPRLVAYYVSGKEVDSADLRSRMALKLPAQAVPSRFVRLAELPLTSNGKIDRTRLKDLAEIEPIEARKIVEPKNDIERLVLGVWNEVLSDGPLSVEDDFLDIGGQSLQAIRIVSRLNERLSMDLPVGAIFDAPTITLLSKRIEREMRSVLEAGP
ncbi:MAG: amino acid adenylation domain-containing protein [Acidobacteria bacterium]|nr:MAG: amino acid adenylation domain-containing protein [Acidobacteriota bacterium]REJ98982.1 MAG: amino acid adenylation domain-containing protein [Acidobacteriota bacterium]REK16298.1 MAG: amino acid adenylation domain-containing protein [Acidobacteriota bacterium]REK43979.1 MAG: amino acid adenylation domain-containing protein [Acidobacteriota bacterium]